MIGQFTFVCLGVQVYRKPAGHLAYVVHSREDFISMRVSVIMKVDLQLEAGSYLSGQSSFVQQLASRESEEVGKISGIAG